tara:strand:+ start:45 stop:323 length:279 start_codon:yes stop_codon:yes gene_type:complete
MTVNNKEAQEFNKTLEDLKKKADEEVDYQGGKAYRAFLHMFYKNKKEENTVFTFKLLNLIKKCREKGKRILYAKLIKKYNIDEKKLEEAYYD